MSNVLFNTVCLCLRIAGLPTLLTIISYCYCTELCVQDSLLQNCTDWNNHARGGWRNTGEGVRQKAERLHKEWVKQQKKSQDYNPDVTKLFIAAPASSLLTFTPSNAVELAGQCAMPELAILAEWTPYPLAGHALVLRSKFGFSQTIHRRVETVCGVPRKLVGSTLVKNTSLSAVAISTGMQAAGCRLG